MMSRMPSQKIGIETPTSASKVPAASKMEFFFTAATTPSSIPITEAKMIAAIASSIVAGKRAPISLATGDFV
jgi:hypothetical protein